MPKANAEITTVPLSQLLYTHEKLENLARGPLSSQLSSRSRTPRTSWCWRLATRRPKRGTNSTGSFASCSTTIWTGTNTST